MRPVPQRLLTGALVVLALLGAFAGGWYVRSAVSPSGTAPASLAVIAAGSLAPVLPKLIASFVAATPGVQAPASAQLYEGSTAAATALTTASQPYDLFLSADFRVIPQRLEPPVAAVTGWEAIFAADPVVLAYAPGGALLGINGTNWYQKIVQPGVVLGSPNASADPLGANAIFTLELEDGRTGQGGALYGHFYAGGMGALATPTAATRYVAENTLASALATGAIDIALTYRSYAVADRLAYVSLGSAVDLGAYDSVHVTQYGAVSTTLLVGGSTAVVHGAPALFALTVPSTAPDTPLGLALAAYLLSNVTSPRWAADGFTPVTPPWVDHPAQVPAALAGFAPNGLPVLPDYLAALL
jgi:molybdate/tungstate transport system substrate-binding protein